MKVSKTWWFMLVQSIYRHLDPNPSFVNLSRRMTRCHNSTITVISVRYTAKTCKEEILPILFMGDEASLYYRP